MRQLTFILSGVVAIAFMAMPAMAATMVSGHASVPDWDQPYEYGPIGSAAPQPVAESGPWPDPNIPPGPDQYDHWCSPMAASNLMGWWEDFRGQNGLCDGQAWTSSANWPNNAGYNQALWHDGCSELGFEMDTNNCNPGQYGNPPHNGTYDQDISPGAQSYATNQGFACNIRVYDWTVVGITPASIWDDYTSDIDSGFVNLVSFEKWVSTPWIQLLDDLGDADPNNDVYLYNWGPSGELGHTTTGVGYIDVDPNQIDGQEYFIVHDNWSTTVMNVAVQAFIWDGVQQQWYTWWKQTDHIYVPEPVTMALFGLGLGATLLLRRKRR